MASYEGGVEVVVSAVPFVAASVPIPTEPTHPARSTERGEPETNLTSLRQFVGVGTTA
ncbi:hypothetical protein [Haladaptatus caseinilyticus]|uniref:hypothetical protein n=1 Tax=Haladaptatus caseinilyticus TaxID=2993314 RepID=UPI00224A7C23|nr:hypothetical protein [Haladaptatus caseinilyticus]